MTTIKKRRQGRGFSAFFQNEVFEVETRLKVSEPVFNLHPAFIVGVYLPAFNVIRDQGHRASCALSRTT